jgi:hypothetical protein
MGTRFEGHLGRASGAYGSPTARISVFRGFFGAPPLLVSRP